MDEIPSLL